MDRRTLITVIILAVVVIGVPVLLFLHPGSREAMLKTTEQTTKQSTK